jgi:hypothetical protein
MNCNDGNGNGLIVCLGLYLRNIVFKLINLSKVRFCYFRVKSKKCTFGIFYQTCKFLLLFGQSF